MLLIFDLDGTLIDSRADLTLAVNRTRESFGLAALAQEKVVGFIGNGAKLLVERSLADAPEVPLAEALGRMKRFYAEDPTAHTVLYDGAADSLRTLTERGVMLAVVTNKPEEPTVTILKRLGVLEYFDQVIGGGRMALKPDPEALLHCLAACRERAEESWMIGDHYTDLEAGRRAGMRRAFAAWGFGDPRDESYERRLETFPEVLTLEPL